MTVSELIEFLKTQPQHLPVAFKLHSEQVMMDTDDIEVTNLCFPRPDGWIENKRPDKETQPYLLFPGN